MPLIRSVLAYVSISLLVLLLGPVVILIAIFLGRLGPLFAAAHFGVEMGCWLSGVRLVVSGRQNIPRDRACVFAANHTSYIDGPILFHVLGSRVKALAKAESFRLPVLGWGMRAAGFVPVERNNREAAVKSLRRAAQYIRQGKSFLFFAEGTRSRTGTLQPFKKGGFIMAIEAQAPIVPVVILGGREVMPRGRGIIHPAVVRISIGEPVDTAGLSFDDRQRLIADVRVRVERMIALLQVPDGPQSTPARERPAGAPASNS